MGAERAAQIAEMVSMGFERSQIDLAMRAAFYNSERAIEYLLTVSQVGECDSHALTHPQGIPENLQAEQRQPAAQPAATSSPPAATPGGEDDDEPVDLFQQAAQARGGAGGAGNLFGAAGAGAGAAAAAGGLGNLDFLRNNPQFQQLRQVVNQNPHMLEPILQQVGAGNPQLAALIGQNPEQFLQLLMSEDAENDAPLPPGAQTISVTEEEREAIERVSCWRYSI